MTFPSQKQAYAFWLHASGMTAKQIGKALTCSPQCAQATLDGARKKAAKIGLTYKIDLKEQPNMPNESGLGIAMRLAREANLIK